MNGTERMRDRLPRKFYDINKWPFVSVTDENERERSQSEREMALRALLAGLLAICL